MKFGLILLSILSLVTLSACTENPSAPAVQDMDLDKGSVRPGESDIVNITLSLEASDVDGESDRQSDPFSLLVTIPPGASFVAGSSTIAIQGARAPNAVGSCGDGRSYLLYDFQVGEINNSFNFKKFTDNLSFSVTLQLSANDALVSAVASEQSPANPCDLFEGESLTLGVSVD